MTHFENLPPDLESTAERLRRDRPLATPGELERALARAVASAPPSRPSRIQLKIGALMKTRLAATAVLCLGLVLSTAGGAVAIDGVSSSQNAATAQYGGVGGETGGGGNPGGGGGTPGGGDTGGGGVGGETGGGGVGGETGGGVGGETGSGGTGGEDTGSGGVGGVSDSSGGSLGSSSGTLSAQDSQRGEQAQAGSGELAATGFLAIPLLMAGLATLGLGLVLTARTRRTAPGTR